MRDQLAATRPIARCSSSWSARARRSAASLRAFPEKRRNRLPPPKGILPLNCRFFVWWRSRPGVVVPTSSSSRCRSGVAGDTEGSSTAATLTATHRCHHLLRAPSRGIRLGRGAIRRYVFGVRAGPALPRAPTRECVVEDLPVPAARRSAEASRSVGDAGPRWQRGALGVPRRCRGSRFDPPDRAPKCSPGRAWRRPLRP